jgi:cobalt-zinc-cadmium resistance protein CzcA
MTLKEVTELATKQAQIIRVNQLQEKYYSVLKGSAREIPKTQIITELGNYNSFNFDSRISVTQTLQSGAFFRKQESVLNNYLATANANTVIQQSQLKKMVAQLYLQLQFFYARRKIFERTDSIYSSYQKMAQLRFEKGESNLLEKTTIDNQVMQNKQLLLMNESDTKSVQLELALLMQEDVRIEPSDELVAQQQLYDTALLKRHPELKMYEAQTARAKSETELEKSRLRPEWLVGYNNQSLMGWMTYKNRSERYFDAGNRFSSVTLGMSVPFFNKSRKAKIEAAGIQEDVIRAEADMAAIHLRTRLLQCMQNREKLSANLAYFKNSAIPQSNTIIQTAGLQYKNGQINYIEWGTLVTQALAIQVQYAEARREHQLNEIELDYLLQNNQP